MLRILTVLFALAITSLLSTPILAASGEPSSDAMGMPGALGTFEFMPADWMEGTTTWWEDSDGVDPGLPGCHIGTDENGEPNGRFFGEACMEDGILVESNPGAGKLHSHTNDVGHPDTFDCTAWCAGTGFIAGSCVATAAPPCEQSAMCVCE